MKTTLTQKIDNYLETNHGIVTLLATICVFVGGLFALGMSDDYGIATLTSFGVVFFLVVFGAIIGALGAYIIAEKIGYANSAQVSRSLHKHYNAELANLQAELANAYTAHADTIDGMREAYNALENSYALTIRNHNDQIVNLRNEFLDENYLETYSLVNLLTIALDPMHEDHHEAQADLRAFIPNMDSEALTRYAVARWNGEGYSDDDMNHLARYRETFGGYNYTE